MHRLRWSHCLLCASLIAAWGHAEVLNEEDINTASPNSGAERVASRKLLQTDASVGKHVTPELKQLFQELVDLADRISVVTRDQSAVILQLRTAFQACPTCPAANTVGKATQAVFYLDEYADRTFMSEKVLPAVYAEKEIKRLLWVGVKEYTLRYEYMLAEHGIEMTTIEIDHEQAKWGSSVRHIVDPIQRVDNHFEPKVFDAVIINGVLGWGLNSHQDISQALKSMHRVLKPNGLLVVGYNHGMVDCCGQFEPLYRPVPLGSLPHKVDLDGSEMHHVYTFFRKDDKAHPHQRQGNKHE